MYIYDTFIANMLEVIPNGATKDKLLESYSITTLFQDTVGERLIKLVFKYDCAVKKYYVGSY